MNELVQEIITFLIVSITAGYTLYKFALFFIPSKNKNYCSSCSGSSSCGLKQNFSNKHFKGKIKVMQ